MQQMLLNQISFGLNAGQSCNRCFITQISEVGNGAKKCSFSNFFGQSAGYQQQMLPIISLYELVVSATNASYSNFMVNKLGMKEQQMLNFKFLLVCIGNATINQISLVINMLVMVQQMHLTQVSLSKLGKMQQVLIGQISLVLAGYGAKCFILKFHWYECWL
jgi:hypothetical protein